MKNSCGERRLLSVIPQTGMYNLIVTRRKSNLNTNRNRLSPHSPDDDVRASISKPDVGINS